jgi:two-component system, NarL family, nitrate/nitrite response regulator NarL
MKIFVALIGSDPIPREGIVSILRKGGFSHARSYSSVVELSEARVPANRHIVCLVDLRQKYSDLPAIVEKLRIARPEARVVLLVEADDTVIMQAMECDVDGILLDKIGRDVFLKSLELVVLGEKVFPATNLLNVSKRSREFGTADIDANIRPDTLSLREAQVLQKLTVGQPNKVIARECGITESTVKVHVKAILRKIHAKNRTQAAVWARKYGPNLMAHLGDLDQTFRRVFSNREVQKPYDSISIQSETAPTA